MHNRKAIAPFVSLVTFVLLALPAGAAELLPEQHYADALQRCVASIRAELVVGAETPLQHRVTTVRKENIWYVFDIATVQSEAHNQPERLLAETQCRAWRFDDKTIAVVEPVMTGMRHLAESR